MNIAEWWQGNETLLQTLFTYYIFGLSIQIVLRAGVFSLASAGTWAVSGYTTAILVERGVAWPLAVVAGLILAAIISLGIAVLFGRLSGLYLGMATIAFDLLVVSVAYSWDSVTGGALGLYGIPREVTGIHALVLAVGATLVVALLQGWSGGRAVDLMRADLTLARTVGINVLALRRNAIVLSGVMGGLSGAISPLIFGVLGPSDGGFSLVVLGLTIVVIGGSGSWLGPVLGALVVTLLPELLRFVEQWRDLVYGAIVVVMVIFAPRGLIGFLPWLRGRFRSRRQARLIGSASEAAASSEATASGGRS